jgi:transcription antitermination factor NusG
MRENIHTKYWLAFYTRPRHEFTARSEILHMGLEVYLPVITLVKKWSDRKKKVTEPLFKSYIFAYCDETERYRILQSKSIVTTVFHNGKPAHVPDWQIEGIKRMLDGNREVKIVDGIKKGARVKINNGPFEGLEGIIFTGVNNEKYVAVSIDLLNRSVITKLPIKDIELSKAI